MKKFIVTTLCISMGMFAHAGEGSDPETFNDYYAPAYQLPDLNPSAMPADAADGADIFWSTYKYLGAESGRTAANGQPYVGNKMSCANCHGANGTKPNGAPMITVSEEYRDGSSNLKYSSRTGEFRNVLSRVNGCMQRSMAGEPLEVDAPEFLKLKAYFDYLYTGLQPGYGWKDIAGNGFPGMFKPPSRKADVARGEEIYENSCKSCHQDDASGVWRDDEQRFRYPALSGPHTNGIASGAGRIETLFKLVIGNMPFDKTDSTNTSTWLTEDDAWDVSGYLMTKPRPWKARYLNDWTGNAPDGMPLWMKRKADAAGPTTDPDMPMREWVMPRDCGDGVPVGDTSCPPMYSMEQHNVGPLQPIKDKLAEARATWLLLNDSN